MDNFITHNLHKIKYPKMWDLLLSQIDEDESYYTYNHNKMIKLTKFRKDINNIKDIDYNDESIHNLLLINERLDAIINHKYEIIEIIDTHTDLLEKFKMKKTLNLIKELHFKIHKYLNTQIDI